MNCTKRQAKALTATILMLAMLLLNCFSAFAATVIPAEYQDIEIRPYRWNPTYVETWKTDSHKLVAIRLGRSDNSRVAMRGYDAANDKWVQTTCGDGGFMYGIYNTHKDDKLELTATPSIVNNGTGFEMKIGVKNTGVASASDFKVYIGADTMLDGNDASVNTPSADHLSITMEANGYAMEIGGKADNGFKIFPTSYSNYRSLGSQDPATIQEVTTRCDSAFVGYWVFTTANEVGPGQSVELSFRTDVGGGFNPVADIIWEEYKQYYVYGESLVTTENAYAIGEDPGEAPTKCDIVWNYGGFDPTRSGNYIITATVKGGLGTKVVEKEVTDIDFVKTWNVTVFDAQKPGSGSSGSVATSVNTGTWGAPVTDGTWSQAADGSWSYKTTQQFRSTWGYIRNPYAKGGQSADGWFYFDANGKMLTGWQQINGSWYYLNNTSDGTLGMCYLNTLTPDGYRVDEKGAAMKDANGNWIRK